MASRGKKKKLTYILYINSIYKINPNKHAPYQVKLLNILRILYYGHAIKLFWELVEFYFPYLVVVVIGEKKTEKLRP